MIQEQLSHAITLKELFSMQSEVDNLESTLKIKRERFLDACKRWYPKAQQDHYCEATGYELYWIPRPTRSIIAEKLKQDMPSTFNLIVKETVNVADAEKALGDVVEQYITTRTTYSPKVILCPDHEEEKREEQKCTKDNV